MNDTNKVYGFSWREFFWNYPRNIVAVISITNPLFYILIGLFVSNFLFSFFISDASKFLVESRDSNEIREGVLGSLGSTNPMYITKNEVDRDFYSLVFKKFIYIDDRGNPLPGIASEWEEVSDLEYVFRISDDFMWHDGVPVTVDDVIWNFNTSIDLAREHDKDTYGGALEGVKIERLSNNRVKFTLDENNATFWEAVSVYIVPKHIYGDVSMRNFDRTKSFVNVIGCGLYRVLSITENGMFLHSDDSNIQYYRYYFFDNYDDINIAIKNNNLDVVSNIDLDFIDDLGDYPFLDVYNVVLSNRQKLIYFNTRRDKLSNEAIRQGVSFLIDKDVLLDESNISGLPSKGPISDSSWAFFDDLEYYEYSPKKAKDLFKSVGWSKDGDFYKNEDDKILSLELKYLNNEVNNSLVNALESLLSSEGILLVLHPLSYDQLTREVLPTRDFELLLNEIEVTVDPDQYNLWHSLMSDHPNLNISGYNYSRVDILLERARTNLNESERLDDYHLFQRYLVNDSPAIFLYYPDTSFLVRNNLKGFNLDDVINLSDRYTSVSDWKWD